MEAKHAYLPETPLYFEYVPLAQSPLLLGRHVHKARWTQFDIHAACEMGIVIRGSLKRIYRDESVVLRAGGIWWHGPWEAHGGIALASNTEVVVVLCVPSLLCTMPTAIAGNLCPYLPFIQHSVRAKLQPRSPAEKRDTIERAKQLAAEYAAQGPDWQTALSLDFLRLIVELMRGRRFEVQPMKEKSVGVAGVFKVVEYVQEHAALRLTLKEAAQMALMGRTHFAQLFKEVMGISFARYVRNYRLEKASQEILQGEAKVSTIASDWGFSDSSHFIREYRRHFGKTPKARMKKR